MNDERKRRRPSAMSKELRAKIDAAREKLVVGKLGIFTKDMHKNSGFGAGEKESP